MIRDRVTASPAADGLQSRIVHIPNLARLPNSFKRVLSADWDGVSSDRAREAVTRREKTRVELSLYQREDVGLCHALHVQFHLHSLSKPTELLRLRYALYSQCFCLEVSSEIKEQPVCLPPDIGGRTNHYLPV